MEIALNTSPWLKQTVERTTGQMKARGNLIDTKIGSMQIMVNPITNHMLLQTLTEGF